uniref:DNA helicase n=1 Tax=Angiostrongylus cantonensis TaxID=6313 RepID=A0A0K0D5L1_ANGCA
MSLKNIGLALGVSNGSRGVVTRFSKSGFPVVKFLSTQEEVEILPIRFSVRIPGQDEHAYRRQRHLQFAWAILIHKSQGLTLDAVEVSLERARSLAVRVIAFDPCVIRSNHLVVKYYESIKMNAALRKEDENFIVRRHCWW